MASNGLRGDFLKGKKVLVTRPKGQAQGLIKAIQAQGGEAICCPVLSIEPAAATETAKQKIINLDQYDDLIFVSSNAVRFGFNRIRGYWPQLPAHLHWFAVGKRTAACLKDEGIDALVPDKGFNSEALLQLSELQQIASRRVLIFKGEGGRELLAQSLADRGAQVESLALYRRQAVHYSPGQLQSLFAAGLPEALIATSVEVLMAMDALLKPCLDNFLGLPLVVASKRIGDAAGDLGYQQIITADSAAHESIVSALNVIG